MEQQTLVRSFTLEGAGIHTGAFGRIAVHPADADTGRVFRVGSALIPARVDFVVDATRCTTLGRGEARISTVEHLLSALYALNVDNALIEVEGPEIPILDGSALPFVQAIQQAGIVGQGQPPRLLRVREAMHVENGATQAALFPHPYALALEAATTFDEWPQGDVSVSLVVGADDASDYADKVAPARTFAFQREVEMLRAAGLAKGGSLDNALIIAPPDTFSSPLRVPNEWCAHKLLDLIGDLALVNARLQALIQVTRPGHRFNTGLAARLLQSQP